MAPPQHVAVVAFPFSSHAAVLFPFARALAASAPPEATLSFLTTADSAAQLRKAGAPFPENLRLVEIRDGAPSAGEGPMIPPPRRMQLFMEATETGGLRDGLEAARAAAGGVAVTCVVGDAFVWMAAEEAAAAGVPWVPVWTGASCVLLSHVRTDKLREDVADEAASRAEDLLTAHPGLGDYRIRDLPKGVVSGDFDFIFSVLLHRMGQRLPRAATAIALNTFPGLDPPELAAALDAELPTCLPLGPYHLLLPACAEAPADPHGCLAWLDNHPARAVAYVSFGTLLPHPNELRELAAGLEASGALFMWSLREEAWPMLPEGFLERLSRGVAGLVVPWTSQLDVLRHASVGAFVTDAGWSSVLEGVSSGVPMACRAFFGDHAMNARSVAHVCGFGTAFDGAMTRRGVEKALASLLNGEEGARMRTRVQELQPAGHDDQGVRGRRRVQEEFR